jgi:hypothetical protein
MGRMGEKSRSERKSWELENAHEELDSQFIKGIWQFWNLSPNKVLKFLWKDTPNASKSDDQEEAKTADRKEVIPALSTAQAVDSLGAQPNFKLISENAVIRNPDPLKDKSIFGFAVVKRSNPSAAAVGKKPHVDRNQANQPNNSPAPPPAVTVRKVVDIPETASSWTLFAI